MTCGPDIKYSTNKQTDNDSYCKSSKIEWFEGKVRKYASWNNHENNVGKNIGVFTHYIYYATVVGLANANRGLEVYSLSV